MTTAKKPRKRRETGEEVCTCGDKLRHHLEHAPRACLVRGCKCKRFVKKRRETPERRLKCRTCGAGFLSRAGQAPCPKPTPGREYVDTGRGNHVFTKDGPPPKPKRETPEQKARRVGKAAGLDFYLLPMKTAAGDVAWFKMSGTGACKSIVACRRNPTEIALWRALARETGVRL